MTTTTQRLESSFDFHRKHFAALFDALDGGGDLSGDASGEYGTDDASEALAWSVLSVDVVRTVRIALTLGGPNIYLLAELDADGFVQTVTYEAHWGGDSFSRRLPAGDPLTRLAEYFAEGVAT